MMTLNIYWVITRYKERAVAEKVNIGLNDNMKCDKKSVGVIQPLIVLGSNFLNNFLTSFK